MGAMARFSPWIRWTETYNGNNCDDDDDEKDIVDNVLYCIYTFI